MGDYCMENCPVIARVEALEGQVDELGAQNSSTHREIFDRLRAIETAAAVTGERYNAIIEKLDNLTKKVTELEQKPAKRWEAVVGALIGAVVSGVTVYLLTVAGIG